MSVISFIHTEKEVCDENEFMKIPEERRRQSKGENSIIKNIVSQIRTTDMGEGLPFGMKCVYVDVKDFVAIIDVVNNDTIDELYA